MFAGLNEPSTPACFTHEGGERPMSLKLQNQLCKAQNRRVLVMVPDIHYPVRPKLCTSETDISEREAPVRNIKYTEK